MIAFIQEIFSQIQILSVEPSLQDLFSPELLAVCFFAFLAGFIDSIVGGGGLVQLPALLICYPNVDPIPIFGTNKFSSISGTSIATYRFSRTVEIPWRIALWAAGAAFIFSFLGARSVSYFPKDALRPVILTLLIAVFIYTAFKKDFGSIHAPELPHNREVPYAIILGVVIGFYDGFFGPGTGSFLIFIFIGIFGFDFLRASATAKVVNFSTNLSAVLFFAFTQKIFYHIAIPMGLCNIAGAVLGTKLAVLKGSGFIRVLFLGVMAAIILKFGFDTLKVMIQI
ncbi:MAG: TSUP family transporter [Chloroherpetonaceae bacterium]|nr:TSUP family transporter [Chloroherpetonaceae bacterium]